MTAVAAGDWSGTGIAPAVVLGLLFGVGVLLILLQLPVFRRGSFADRVEPQLKYLDARSKLLAVDRPVAFGPLDRLLRLLISDATKRIGKFNIGVTGLAAKLEKAGRSESPLEFRAVQYIWAGGGLLVGIVVSIMLAAGGRTNVVTSLSLTIGLALAGYLGYEQLLAQRIKKRQARIMLEFPAMAELMALAVSAGESAANALARVARASKGELAEEFAQVLAQTRTGVPLIEALNQLSKRLDIAAISRFVDGIGVAINRGTPLADVLRAQAQDVRDIAKRELMESAGRKEIAMMVPLIFGVLPLTVVFAVFPGLALLQIGL